MVKTSQRSVEHSKILGEAPKNRSTEGQVTKCVRTEVMNPKLINVPYKTFLGSVAI